MCHNELSRDVARVAEGHERAAHVDCCKINDDHQGSSCREKSLTFCRWFDKENQALVFKLLVGKDIQCENSFFSHTSTSEIILSTC